MATLLEALRGQLSGEQLAGTVPQTGALGGGQQTQQLTDLMRAKTGRIVTSGAAPRASALGEAAAGATAQAQGQQIQQQGILDSQSLGSEAAAQASQAQQENQALELTRLRQQDEYANRAASLIQELRQGNREIDMKRDQARVEQLGFLTRLSNEQYLDQLERAGAESRLEDQNAFDEALAKNVFSDERAALGDKLNYAEVLNADDNEFQRLMGSMSLDFAMQMASAQSVAANQQAMYQGLGGLTSAGISAYGKQQEGAFDSDYQKWKAENDSTGTSYEQYKKQKS